MTAFEHQNLRDAVASITVELPARTFFAMAVIIDAQITANPGGVFLGTPKDSMNLVKILNPNPAICYGEIMAAITTGQERIFEAITPFFTSTSNE